MKLKNTYVVEKPDLLLINLNCFSDCPQVMWKVVKINGVEQPNGLGGWDASYGFPKYGAQVMCNACPKFEPVMGNLALTIVEYLDKETRKKPVLTLFPQNFVFFHDLDITIRIQVMKNGADTSMLLDSGPEYFQRCLEQFKRLNHPSRQDLFGQVEIRQKFIAQYNETNKVR